MRHAALGLTVLVTVLVAASWPPIRQSLDYHDFADRRTLLGIPNGLNVLSNVPFAIVGLSGLAVTFSRRPRGSSPFSDPWERWPYAALFAGVALTSLGSGYYHLAPDNARLVWDRLPMSVGFMGLLTALLAERVSLSIGRWLFVPLLATGAAGVFYWYWSELRGAGDLRLYVLVQFGSLLWIVLLLVLYPARSLRHGLPCHRAGRVWCRKGLRARRPSGVWLRTNRQRSHAQAPDGGCWSRLPRRDAEGAGVPAGRPI